MISESCGIFKDLFRFSNSQRLQKNKIFQFSFIKIKPRSVKHINEQKKWMSHLLQLLARLHEVHRAIVVTSVVRVYVYVYVRVRVRVTLSVKVFRSLYLLNM